MPEQKRRDWQDALLRTETLSRSGRVRRLWHDPLRYLEAMIFRHLIFRLSGKPRLRRTPTFFGEELLIPLPACTDIFLTGGKSHDSEIRLSRFLLQHLQEGDTVLDLGAHVGFFTRLCSALCGESGRVVAVEPSAGTFAILKQNAGAKKNIVALDAAVGAETGEIPFYEFASSHSEYSSTDAGQYAGEAWFDRHRPQLRQVRCETINSIVARYALKPNLIKIDVEGGEQAVIRGAGTCLQTQHPVIVMEFHAEGANRERHIATLHDLQGFGYGAFRILSDGNLSSLEPDSAAMGSDNVVFVHPMGKRKIPGSGY